MTILHSSLGKQEFLARGGKKIHAKLTPLLQPLLLVNLWVAPTRGEFPTVIDVEVIEDFALLKQKSLRLRFALKSLDILGRATYPLLEAQTLLKSSIAILHTIAEQEHISDLKKLWIYFELRVLDYLGAKPSRKDRENAASLTHLARSLEKRIHDACY